MSYLPIHAPKFAWAADGDLVMIMYHHYMQYAPRDNTAGGCVARGEPGILLKLCRLAQARA